MPASHWLLHARVLMTCVACMRAELWARPQQDAAQQGKPRRRAVAVPSQNAENLDEDFVEDAAPQAEQQVLPHALPLFLHPPVPLHQMAEDHRSILHTWLCRVCSHTAVPCHAWCLQPLRCMQREQAGKGSGGFQTARSAYNAELRRSGRPPLPLQARGNSGPGGGSGRRKSGGGAGGGFWDPDFSSGCMFPEGQGAFSGSAAPRVGMPRGRGGRRGGGESQGGRQIWLFSISQEPPYHAHMHSQLHACQTRGN
jgi:hypothetical protein